MTGDELEKLLTELESDLAERTASSRDTDKLGEAICAFANDLPDHRQPGVLFVGVDNDGSCANLDITDRLLQNLAAIRSDGNLLPQPSMMVEKHVLRGCEMAVITVQPASDPPVRYKGVVWIRVGPRRARASAQDERLLTEKRRFRDQPFDLRPLSMARVEDLDQDLFENIYLPSSVAPDILLENDREYHQKLSSLRLVNPEDLTPTTVGLLSIARDPLRFLPGAYVQFLRIDGVDLVDPVKDQKMISGPLSQLMIELDDILKAHNSISGDFVSTAIEIDSPAYPIVALQQIVRNAVMHRNYEATNAPIRLTWFNDRVEINSPGGPYGNVTIANFGKPGITDYRNPHLAEALKNLGFVQRFGAGIALARREMQKNQNPEIEFEISHNFVLAILRVRAL